MTSETSAFKQIKKSDVRKLSLQKLFYARNLSFQKKEQKLQKEIFKKSNECQKTQSSKKIV